MKRKPDIVIGGENNPYLLRWYIIPRNRFLNIYLHKMVRSDDDRALHDHPWWWMSIMLKGGYIEVSKDKNGKSALKHYRRGSIRIRSAEFAHRLVLTGSGPCWTLFLTGPKIREWGFYCPQGWRHWKVFTAGPKGEEIGKGCE